MSNAELRSVVRATWPARTNMRVTPQEVEKVRLLWEAGESEYAIAREVGIIVNRAEYIISLHKEGWDGKHRPVVVRLPVIEACRLRKQGLSWPEITAILNAKYGMKWTLGGVQSSARRQAKGRAA